MDDYQSYIADPVEDYVNPARVTVTGDPYFVTGIADPLDVSGEPFEPEWFDVADAPHPDTHPEWLDEGGSE